MVQELDESEGQIVSCLQDSRDMLMNMQCRDQVHKMMARASEDIRFNQMLADACFNDREQFCSTTQQVRFTRCYSCACSPAKLQLSWLVVTCHPGLLFALKLFLT